MENSSCRFTLSHCGRLSEGNTCFCQLISGGTGAVQKVNLGSPVAFKESVIQFAESLHNVLYARRAADLFDIEQVYPYNGTKQVGTIVEQPIFGASTHTLVYGGV